jgi:hypothetical protein
MISHPSMTSRGKRIAGVIAVMMLFLLPKQVACGFPGAECAHAAFLGRVCTPYELEPLGFYLIEKVVERDVGFAYTRGETCR